MIAAPDLVQFLSAHPGPFSLAIRGDRVDLEFEDGARMENVTFDVMEDVLDARENQIKSDGL